MADLVKRRLAGKELMLEKIALEVRYEHGFLYLDKCGSLINALRRAYPEWILDPDEANPQGAALYSIVNGAAFTISATTCVLNIGVAERGKITESTVEGFQSQVSSAVSMALNLLSVSENITRIGVRFWFIVPFDDKPEAEEWLREIGWFSPKDCFGGKEFGLSASSYTGVYEHDCKAYRINIQGLARREMYSAGNSNIGLNARQLTEEQRQLLKENSRSRKDAHKEMNPVRIDIDCSESPVSYERLPDFVFEKLSYAYETLASTAGQ